MDARELIEVDPAHDVRWDAFVGSRRDGSIFHHSAWLRALEAEYSGRVVGLACTGSHGELLGVLPLLSTRGLPFRRKSGLSGPRLSSLPRTPTAGPLAVDQAAMEALVRGAVDRVRARPDWHLQLKLEGPHLDGLVEEVRGERWRHTFVLELPSAPEELRFGNARNNARIRWAVTKAERLQVRVRAAREEAELRAWYRLYLETMRRHAVPPRPFRFFSALWTTLRPHRLMELLLAEHQSDTGTHLLAGSIFLKFGQTVFYGFNGSHQNALSLRPNDIIMWNAIYDACAAGYRRFDLGEVDAGSRSLADFKRKWGSEPSWLYRYYYPARPTEQSYSESTAVRAARAVWRYFPLRGTAVLGDRIYSFM
jgi:CelD/BcsL family acetyltransferase involved in cellulose biosynthesis